MTIQDVAALILKVFDRDPWDLQLARVDFALISATSQWTGFVLTFGFSTNTGKMKEASTEDLRD
jgi:hypothetical protein